MITSSRSVSRISNGRARTSRWSPTPAWCCRALEAAEILAKEGIDVEVVDLRTLKPLDIDTIVASVKKTGRVVGVTEAYENTSFINEVMAQINELAFDYLDAPMVRVAALPTCRCRAPRSSKIRPSPT